MSHYIQDPDEAKWAWLDVVTYWRHKLENVGKPKVEHRITDWRTAIVVDTPPTHDVNREINEVWFDLPLDGIWSDLTATFDIWKLDKCIVLQLEQIHVM